MHAYILALLLILVYLILLSKLRRITTEPYAAADVLVTEFVENSITCKNNEIVLFRNLVNSDLWLSFDYIWISASILKFGFCISKCAAYWKPTGQHSDRSYDVLRVLRLWLISFFLCLWKILGRSSLVNLATCLDDSFVFIDIGWLVVTAQCHYLLTSTWRENSSTVTHVGRVADFSDNEHHDGARTWSLNYSELASDFV